MKPESEIVLPGRPSPCGRHCAERQEDCKKTCRRWKSFQIWKMMEYEKNRLRVDADSKAVSIDKRLKEEHRKRRK